ncbi:exosome complex exonuclease rrp41 [Theileria orientalis strain Shintoku]|uniref:Exosome complex exonuclease rrp41 n=1 Tax=Theileria orientalis strain Shintoku TaxID=869250 RepID=J4C2L3_THEOR|nr:exosome complex exonuclease rrp41 [Theileria orientalis strain Shintoku]BAM38891.1 exosome complex exonuclease rrp41 [Theileria orientalis strain Shintoku]|eukprot:XP_009689192.1 exosome complex exonuclease rrp41 [Theileria orientalis strain Shintoku]
MSKIEYFSLEGLRLDGRRKDELRKTKLYCGSDCSVDFMDYDGVSELIQGLNKVQVLVKGPQEDPRSSKNTYGIAEERIDIRCEIVMATEKRVKNSQNERVIKDLSLSVKSTYQEMIISHYYKGCSLNVFVNIIEYDGSIKSTVLNAVGVALVDAGVAIKDLVSSSTVISLDSIILTDPNQMELKASTAVLCVAVESSTDKIIYMDYKSKIHLEEINTMVEAAFAASKKFTDYAREVLRNYSKKAVALNQKIHSE